MSPSHRLLRRAAPCAFAMMLAGMLTGCTQWVDTPAITQTEPRPVPMDRLDAVLARITPPVRGTGVEHEWHPSPRSSVKILRAGDDLGFGVTMTPEAETLWTATNHKDWKLWLEQYEAARRSLPDTPEAGFLLSSQKIRAMLHAGRMDEAEAELKVLARHERAIFGNVLETTSQYAQLNSWLHNSRDALAWDAAVVHAVGDWWIPTFYYAPPENIGDAKRIAGAMMRAHIGLTCENVVLHNYEDSMAWGRQGLDMTESVLGISHHPLYGFFVKPTTYMYEGEAWMLTCYAAARIGVSRNLEANRELIGLAKDFFRQAEYRWGDYLVDSVVNYVLYDTGLKPQETARIGVLPEPGPVTPSRLAALVRPRPDHLEVREDVELPVPEPDSIRLPGEGQGNAYGFAVGPDLAAANAAILSGDYPEAIAKLDAIAAAETDPLKRWHAAEAAVKTLILAGRSAEALARIPALETLETGFFGGTLGARALRGEAKFWLGDNDGALRDFLQVVEALGDFRPPTLLVFKPEVPQVALMTRAQYLAYLGVARSLMFSGDAKAAAPWARAGEQLFEEAHYAWRHQLYRRYLKLDADMFYARGVNLSVLAGAELVADGDMAKAEATMATARAYLDAMGFDAGLVTIEATWARALLDAGRAEAAASSATEAARLAVDRGQTDLLWQVQALRGEALRRMGDDRGAERALRAAEAAVEEVSGALATDASKRRFGLGKEDITRRLVAYDLARGDEAAAFADLERGRARAFVDMLGAAQLTGGRRAEDISRIRALDKRIREARIRAALPGRAAADAPIAEMTRRRAGLVAALRAKDPDLADALSISTASLSAVQRKLGPADRMLYALPAEDGAAPIRFLSIRRGGAEVIETGLSGDALSDLLAVFTSDDPLGAAPAQEAAAQRIAGAFGLGGAAKGALYVAPSGPLYYVPWGALPVESPVVVLPTGGWILRAPPTLASARAVALGDPSLGTAWDALPGAGAEAMEVAAAYGVQPLSGAAATREALREKVGKGARVLHLATHGVFDPREPLRSAILLSGADGPDRLTAEDLYETPLPASLVVLSACETGLGQVSGGDDFLGLARSFYLGGARAVMNSLWPVYDKPTRRFMEVFHAKAKDGDVGAAWLAARDALRAEGFPPAVYGAFVLGGASHI